MRVITIIPNDDLIKAQAVAKIAEKVGFDGIVAAENAHNPYLPLAAAALVTERIRLGTAVAMAFPRSPTINAMVAWDVQNASKGRFFLGIGSQVKAHNERRYGLTWTPPMPRMRDYIGALRAIWHCWEKGVPLNYQSDTYKLNLMTPNFSPRPNGLPPIPIGLATVGPAMLRLAGETCDAAILHPFSTKKYLTEVSLARITEGLAKGNRSRENIEVIAGGYGFLATGPNAEAVEKARQYARYRISFYCSTRAYWDVLRLHDLEWLGEKLNPFPRENRWSEMAAQIPEDKIDLFATIADYANFPRAIEARYGGCVDTIMLQISGNEDVDALGACVEAVQKIPSPFKGRKMTWD